VTTRNDASAGEHASRAAVTVKLFGGLDERAASAGALPGAAQLVLDPRAARTIADVIAAAGLQAGDAGLVLLNGLHVRADAAVCAGDTVSLFPHLSGG
jgi:molybdopterin converting factor small subunit